MFDKPARKFLEDLHFEKPTLDQSLKFKYENCNYTIHIPFDTLPKFNSVTLETIYDGKEKVFSIVSNLKNHDHKDRGNIGRFIHLLAAKYKYDLLQGIDPDNAGFLHIYEIERLNKNKRTEVPSTIYRSLKRLQRDAQKSNSAENRFLSKFLFDTNQLFHLVHWCGNVGYGPKDMSRNTLFWLNLPAENIKITDIAKELSNIQLKKRLSLLFPKKCLLTKTGAKEVVDDLLQRYQNKASFANIQENSKPHIDELPDSRFVKFREMLMQEAISHLDDKLHSEGPKDYIPLDLQISLIKKTEPNEAPASMNQVLNRIWEDFDCDRLQNPQGFYILSSEVGSGKTVFLRNLQHTIIEKTELIPIFLEASELENLQFKKRNPNSFLKSLSRLLDQEDNFYEFLKNYQDKLVFLVDGLDQIEGAGTEYRNLVEKLISVIKDKTVITSRPFAVLNHESNSKITSLRLKSFKNSDVHTYFSDKYERAKELCRTCPEMIRIPMLAYMLRSLIATGKDKGVCNRAKLYSRFVGHIFECHIPGNLKISLDDKDEILDVLGEISFRAIACEKPHLQKIPYRFAKKRLHDRGVSSANIEIETLLKVGLPDTLINRSGSDNLSIYFSHHSFQEYLAAEYIKDNDGEIEQILAEKWNPKWKEVIKFLTNIRGQVIIEMILDEKDNPIHSKLFFSAELVPETDIDFDCKKKISQKIERLLESQLFNNDAEVYWTYVDEIKALNRFTKGLEDENSVVRQSSIKNLVKLKDKLDSRVIEKIVAKLDDEDCEVRRSAVSALGGLNDKMDAKIVKKIVNRLENETSEICSSALSALGQLKNNVDSEIVKKIVAKLEDESCDVRGSSVSALGQLKNNVDSEIVKKIIVKLEDESSRVRWAAVSALGKLEDKVDGEIAEKIVEMFVDDIEDEVSRRPALSTLGKFKDKVSSRVIEKIVAKLEDESSELRESAIEVLGELKDSLDSAIVGKIADKLEDKSIDVCRATILTLGKLNGMVGNKVIKKITAKLKDEDFRVFFLAVFALGQLNENVGSEIVKKIVAKLEDKNRTISWMALSALGRLENEIDGEVIEKIVDKINDGPFGWPALSALKNLKNKIDGEIIKKLVSIKDKRAVAILRILYQDGKLEFLSKT